MLKLLADEGFHAAVIGGLRRHLPAVDILVVTQSEFRSRPDDFLLELAAREDRVVLTHDADTMVGLAWDRVSRGISMPGVVVIRWSDVGSAAIDDLVYMVQAATAEDCDNQVKHLPL